MTEILDNERKELLIEEIAKIIIMGEGDEFAAAEDILKYLESINVINLNKYWIGQNHDNQL